MSRSTDRYEHYSKGDQVRICRPWSTVRSTVGDWEFDRHEEGTTGIVENISNAGFRGLEYSVRTLEGYATGISPTDLELLEAVELRPWPAQGTYRGGQKVG